MPKSATQSDYPRKLNIGCGSQFHREWCNVDLVAQATGVIEHDIRSGLPFEDSYFDAVYHSHVLEHLAPEQGEHLIGECRRVLAPGGVLRIVVPDLEQITRLYLQMLERAWQGEERADENYQWMKLELLDQMVRPQSGGLMGPYMIDSQVVNREFVRSRIGVEVESCCPTRRDAGKRRSEKGFHAISNWLTGIRQRTAMLLLGRQNAAAFREGLFRQQGEIHRWMYDRYSLRRLCDRHGFTDFKTCRADESMIEGYPGYQLDQVAGKVRKPDSLFVECRKSRASVTKAA